MKYYKLYGILYNQDISCNTQLLKKKKKGYRGHLGRCGLVMESVLGKLVEYGRKQQQQKNKLLVKENTFGERQPFSEKRGTMLHNSVL